jgi:hypothetical protein
MKPATTPEGSGLKPVAPLGGMGVGRNTPLEQRWNVIC